MVSHETNPHFMAFNQMDTYFMALGVHMYKFYILVVIFVIPLKLVHEIVLIKDLPVP